jgi:uncharacterized PurR-regulated membrane protein YhhQ (DUF165 family)
VKALGLASFIAYVATIYVANYLIKHYGPVSVGFGLVAPAGVFAAGFAFTFRDLVQRTLGRKLVVLAILVGAAASWTVSSQFALASATAFLVSEFADFSVYTPLEKRSWLGAIALSNTVGLVIDSFLFLTIAFGSLQFLAGQIVGKAWTTAIAVAVIATTRAAYRKTQEARA